MTEDSKKSGGVQKEAKGADYIDIVFRRNPLRVYFNTILYADTFRNAIYLHTDAGVLKTYMTFARLLEIIKSDKRFLHCYKGCVVNMDRVSKILDDDFLMDSGEKVQIRKRGSSQVKKLYLQYILLKQSNK